MFPFGYSNNTIDNYFLVRAKVEKDVTADADATGAWRAYGQGGGGRNGERTRKKDYKPKRVIL